MYTNVYQDITPENKSLKSNFHLHAGTGPNTCGGYEISDVLSLYKEAGYDAICVSNHDLFTDTSRYSDCGMCLVNGYEYSANPHMCCVGTESACLKSHKEAIDQCLKEGGFTILCHPHWQKDWYWPKDMLDGLRGYTGIEIHNAGTRRFSGRGVATDVWDYLLSQGRLIWGVGSDDFHRWYDMAKGWNKIYCEPNKDSLIQAVIQGKFYVSTGLSLEYMKLEGDRVEVFAKDMNGSTDKYFYRFIGQFGQILHEVAASHATYYIKGNEKYIRVEVIDSSGAKLYTQPIYRQDEFKFDF